MKQEISTLMDGELFDDEAENLFNALKRNPAAQEQWHVYHLISDVMQQPGRLHADIGVSMHERLEAEPTVLAPRARTGQKAKLFALSAAASVMALTLVAWLSVQVGSETAPQMAAAQQPSAIRAANFPGNGGINDYLIAHQEFSPSINVQGAASYARTVAGQ